MTLLMILSVPFIAVLVARWAWRLHLRALWALGPGLASLADASRPASSAQVVSVLVQDHTVLVGLRLATMGSAGVPRTLVRAPDSMLVLSLDGRRCDTVA